MIVYYDAEPSKFEAVGNGSVRYRYNIEKEVIPSHKGQEQIQWKCDEVLVLEVLSTKKVVSAVITDKWDSNHEQKLINQYNSVTLGVISGEEADEVIEVYKSFLSERKSLKEAVEKDCAEAGIH